MSDAVASAKPVLVDTREKQLTTLKAQLAAARERETAVARLTERLRQIVVRLHPDAAPTPLTPGEQQLVEGYRQLSKGDKQLIGRMVRGFRRVATKKGGR
jgi:hypothetical protein